MLERQVTIGDETFPLPSLFLVLATQNPIEAGRYVPAAGSARQYDDLKTMLRSIKIDSISISTDNPYIHELVEFFHKRKRRY